MEDWDAPHWSGRPQEEKRPPRLRPNPFARLARFAMNHAWTVVLAIVPAAAVAAVIASLTFTYDTATVPDVALDPQTQAAQMALAAQFPGIEDWFLATVTSANPAVARATAVQIAASLRDRGDLFVSADVPGAGRFYEKFAFLFLPADKIEARVRQALQMQPLFQAMGSAPDLPGLAALVDQIGQSLAQGRSPEGLAGFLLAAARAVEGELAGEPQPVPWPQLAGLAFRTDSNRWFVIAKPVTGRERPAARFAQTAAAGQAEVAWAFPPKVYGNGGQSLARNLMVPGAIAALLVVTVLGVGLGSVRRALPVVAAPACAVALTAECAALVDASLDSVTWTFIGAVAAAALLFSLLLAVDHHQSRMRGLGNAAAIVLAAHHRGPLIAGLCLLWEALWLVWVGGQITSLAHLAMVVGVGTAIAAAVSLLLVPALQRLLGGKAEEPQPHWFDAAVAVPPPVSIVNLRQIAVSLIAAAAAFSLIFLSGVRFGDLPFAVKHAAQLDAPDAFGAVHFLSPPGAAARQTIAAIGTLPEVGAIRWIEQFIPDDTARKRQSLQALAGYLPGLPAPRPVDETAESAATFDGLAMSLRQIANDPLASPELRDAAHRLRRALSLFVNPAVPGRDKIQALENAIFAGFGELPAEAERLSLLPEPTLDDMETSLRERFVSASGQWRLEVLPRPGVSRFSFAAAMRRFSPQAAGEPVVALARSEILHHQAFVWAGIGFLLAVIAALICLRRIGDWLIVPWPTIMAMSLSAATVVGMGLVMQTTALAAAVIATALSLSSAVIIVLGDRAIRKDGRDPTDVSCRAALLPPCATLASVAPLAISGDPVVAGFGFLCFLFVGLSTAVNFVVLPQLCRWTADWR